MKHNGGIVTRFCGLITTDYRPALRCGERAIASVTLKQFSDDAGFGDCPMLIKYKFCTRDGTSVTGEFAATESAFYGIESGDEIPVRYISDHPQINAPDDALSIIKAVPKPSEA